MRPDGLVLLYGAGREARSTRRFLAETAPGTPVEVCADTGEIDIPDTTTVPVAGLTNAFAEHRYDLIVRSPGVSIYKPDIEAARAAGIRVTTNVNLWAEFRRGGATVVAVTGTKGKSTAAKLTHEMLVGSGLDAGLAGNIGVPPLDLAPHKLVVLELSSYQTADLKLAPDVVGITSLYREHTDWHRTSERYFADKLNILAQAGAWKLAVGPQAATHPAFAALRVPPANLLPALPLAFEDAIFDAVRDSRLKGAHNLDNAVLAARLALAAGATEQGILTAIGAFEPLPHRLQEFSFGGLTIVDDSIATTPEAAQAAIAAYPLSRLALIAGGHDRDQDYAGLARQIAQGNVVVLATLPVTGGRIAAAVRRLGWPLDIIEADDLESAIRQVRDRRARFDTLLLSPGAPSYGQFRNFEERGDRFVELARHYFDR